MLLSHLNIGEYRKRLIIVGLDPSQVPNCSPHAGKEIKCEKEPNLSDYCIKHFDSLIVNEFFQDLVIQMCVYFRSSLCSEPTSTG